MRWTRGTWVAVGFLLMGPPAAWAAEDPTDAVLVPVAAAAPVGTAAPVPATAPPATNAPTAPVPFDKRWLEPFFAKGGLRLAAERYRLDDWAGAATQLEQALRTLGKNAPDRLPARYLLALARMNLGAWSDAGTLFEELYTSYPKLAPYHAYHAARCRLRRGDAQGALPWVERVAPRSVPEAEAILVRLDALTALGRWAELAEESQRYLERWKQGPRRAEAQFHVGEAFEKLGRPAADAIAVYRQIWAEAPAEAWARRAEERIGALAAPLPSDAAKAARTPTAAQLVTRGLVFFDRNANVDAEATLTQALTAPGLDPALECRARFHRAQSVFKQRQRPRAAPLFAEAETACAAVSDRDVVVKCLYQGGRCLASGGNAAAAMAKYEAIEVQHPEHSYADDARLRAAELATDAGDFEKAKQLYQEIPTRYPQGDLVGEALFRLAFRAIQQGDNDHALAWLDETLTRIPREELWYAEGRAHYWKARIYDRTKMPGAAQAAYTRAIREYPLSVYAFLSLERLREQFPAEYKTLTRELRRGLQSDEQGSAKDRGGKDGLPIDLAPRAVYGEPGFARAVELARMGLGSDARRELALIGLRAPDSRDAARAEKRGDPARLDALWVTAVLLDRGRVFSASHSIPRYTLTDWRTRYPAGRDEAAWRLAYPRAFPELVDAHSRKNKVPSALQLAIMREESAFNPRIESFANALGLTQMLVKTAQRFSPTKVTRETLLDPARNLELGSTFLSFLLQRFNGAAPLAIAGYNAGESAVERWLRERGDLPLDEFLESIPYDETRNYTKRVMASYLAYSWLYESDQPVPRLTFDVKAGLARDVPARQGRTGR